MPCIAISSASDPRIAPYVDLRNKRLPTPEGRFIAEGELVVRRLLESDYPVESLLIAQGQLDRIKVPEPIPVYYAPPALIEDVAGFRFHRGILGCGLRGPSPALERLVPPLSESATVVVCDGVRDAENLGGILRNCAAFGVDLVVLGGGSVDPLSRRALRVSMATALKLNLYQSPQLETDVGRLRDEFQLHLAATVVDPPAESLARACRHRRLGVLLGNELAGLSAALVSASDSRWTIPMRLQTDSLNVAVASGIFLYHFKHLADNGRVS